MSSYFLELLNLLSPLWKGEATENSVEGDLLSSNKKDN